MAYDPFRVTVTTYQNRKGAHRVAVQMSRDLAVQITLGNAEALDRVAAAITRRIEREEQEAPDEGESEA